MTNEELNTALYEKMFSEQETYRAWLLAQPPEEILNHTYEYTVREDILMSLEYNSLPNTQVQALLKSPSPLADASDGRFLAAPAAWQRPYEIPVHPASHRRSSGIRFSVQLLPA